MMKRAKRYMNICLFLSMVFFVSSSALFSKPSGRKNSAHVLVLYVAKGNGGVKTHCFYMCKMLKNMGLNPIIVMNKEEAAADPDFVSRIQGKCILYKSPKHKHNSLTQAEIKKTKHFIHFLDKVCFKHNVQLIHANWECDLPALKVIKKKRPVKIVYTNHSDAAKWQDSHTCCDAVISVSYLATERLASEYFRKKIKFYDGQPAFDERPYINFKDSRSKREFFKACFNIDIGDRLVCSIVANFYDCKNQTIAIQAFSELIKKHNVPVCLMLAGAGKALGTCSRLAVELAVFNKDVYFLGYIDDPKSLMYHSDIILSSSRMESFGISLIEASALKKPIIATYGTGATRLIINNETGLLFHWNDSAELVNCMLTYIHDKGTRERCAERCHQYVHDNFTYAHGIKKLMRIYQDIGFAG